MKRPERTADLEELWAYIEYLEDQGSNPTPEKVVRYFRENGYTVSAANSFYQYYDSLSGGRRWRDSRGKVIKNWKLKARSLWFTPDNKEKSWIERGF